MSVPATIVVALSPVWTKKSDSNTLFFVKTGTVPTSGYSGVRGTIELRDMSGTFEVQLAVQTSDDGATWGSAVAFGSVRSSEGVHVEVGFDDFTATIEGKLFSRFGHLVKNATGGSTLELAMSGGRVEFK